MSSKFTLQSGTPSEKPATVIPVLMTPKEAAQRLKLSTSWLAKARMRGDGPPYILASGHAVRYAESALLQWIKGRTRLSTSEE
jgi:predicted DNA-binding transcriptional regulator AlpA